MNALHDRLRAWFDAQAWPYQGLGSALGMHAGGDSGEWPCIAEARPDGLVIFSSIVAEPCPPTRSDAMMRAITRANFGLPSGAFELDLDTGELRFRTSIDVGDDVAALTDRLLEAVVYQNIVTTDRYRPAIKRVLDGHNPDAAVANIETALPTSDPGRAQVNDA